MGVSCTKHSYGRGAGKPMKCKDGDERDGALCYPPCRDRYSGVGPVCWGECPSNTRRCGALCQVKGETCTSLIIELTGIAATAIGTGAAGGAAVSAATGPGVVGGTAIGAILGTLGASTAIAAKLSSYEQCDNL